MKTQCPGCKAKFNINEQSVGKRTKCPKCSQPFTIEPLAETSVQPPVKTAEPVEAVEKTVREKPESKKLSKAVYVYCWAAAQVIAGVFGLAGLVLALKKEANSTLVMIFAAGDIFLTCSMAIELLLFYKMWTAIQDSEASATPAKAVGFLFIPVFNIYWALCMITGFAEDYNAFIQRRSIKAKNLSLILSLIYAVMFILYGTIVMTPMMGVLASVGLIRRAFIAFPLLSRVLVGLAAAAGVSHFISYILFAAKTCDAINALPGKSA